MHDAHALQRAVTGDLAAERVTVRAGARSLSCLVWGPEGAPTALLVHGNGGHGHWWDPLVPALAPGRRLLAPDLRGHGQSDRAEPPSYKVEDFGADLLALLDALAPGPAPVPVVAHSMGGRASAWLAARHPERVRALALLDSRLGDLPSDRARTHLARVQGHRDGPSYATREEALANFRLVPDEPQVPPAVLALLAHHATVERAPGDWRFRFDRAVLSLEANSTGDLTGLLDELRCPLWVGYGEKSGLGDLGEHEQIRRRAPGAKLSIFPGAHHFFLSNPGPIGVWLDRFLDDFT